MSAFEYYQKKQKKKLSKIKIPQKVEMTASTPLVSSNSSVFAGITPGPSSSNVFLGSPILGNDEPKLRVKKRKRERIDSDIPEDVVNSTNTSNGSSQGSPKLPMAVEDGKKKKNKKRKVAQHFNVDQDSQGAFKRKSLKISYRSPFTLDTELQPEEVAPEPVSHETSQNGENGVKEIPAVKNPAKKEPHISSFERGRQMLEWFLYPITIEEFFETYWEKQPLFISRKDVNYFDGICSKQNLEEAFRKCPVYLLKNVTVTAYKDGVRTTDTTPGRARPAVVWDMYNTGHSIRVLNPQTFVTNVGTVVTALQEYFRNMVGVNSYLTPAGTQGFAPHFDDIEAFVIQTEGEKQWKVYPPRSESEKLPRFSSPDFKESEIGEPVLEVTVRAGDLLYFPRGWIHQARSVEGQHSLHLTVSTYQCNSWGDYFKQVLPQALEAAIANNVELRKGLPLDFLDEMGFYKISQSDRRDEIVHTAKKLFSHILDHCQWDEAADQLGKEFIHSSYPPQHEQLSEYKWNVLMADPATASIRLVAKNVCRICEEGNLICYYSTDNSLEPKGEELLGFEISPPEAHVILMLRQAYPAMIKCRTLLADDFTVDNLTELLSALVQRGIIEVTFKKKSKSRASK